MSTWVCGPVLFRGNMGTWRPVPCGTRMQRSKRSWWSWYLVTGTRRSKSVQYEIVFSPLHAVFHRYKHLLPHPSPHAPINDKLSDK